MQRTIRYQAAIIRDDHVLLLRIVDHISGETFWLLPGGGREADETEEACVLREVLEETYLHVAIERTLFEGPDLPGGMYQRVRTYLCRILGGEARPGSEPEVDSDEHTTIREIGWFDLRAPSLWEGFPIGSGTYPALLQLRTTLGYN